MESSIKPTSVTFGDDIVALQQSGLFNVKMSLAEIAKASMTIPGIGGDSKASWELITRDFVYRGGLEAGFGITERQISSIQESKILNSDITLGRILEMSAKIPGLEKGASASWELITRDFVLRGGLVKISAIER